MGLRLRKSIKIMPGLKLNLSKSGVSATVGKRGACLNLSSRGAKATVGLPGTGISYSTKLGNGKKKKTGNDSQPLMDNINQTRNVSKKPVSFLGKIGIWFIWAAILFPMSQSGKPAGDFIAMLGSIALAWLTVKWLNKRRAVYNASLKTAQELE